MSRYLEDWHIDGWNADYYDIVEHYFWAPGSIGRRPKENVQPTEIFAKLKHNEEPLNHQLLLFFRLAPSDLVQRLYQTWFKERVGPEFEVQNRYQVDRIQPCDFTQPDLLFVHPDVSFMIEMKVDAHSSADQVLKYVALSHLESKKAGRCKPMRLAYLGKGGVAQIFEGRPESRAEVIERVKKLDSGAYEAKWAFLDDEDWDAIRERLSAMELRFHTYRDLDAVLAAYEAEIDATSPYAETVRKLLDGARQELRLRGLA